MTKLIAISVAMLALGLPSAARAVDNCPVPGTTEQWRTDYCRSLVETDKAGSAQSCLEKEQRVLFRSECTAKLHYKWAMCELIKRGSGAASVEACVKDPLFKAQWSAAVGMRPNKSFKPTPLRGSA